MTTPQPPTSTTTSTQRTTEARTAFLATLTSVGSHHDSALQSRSRDIHGNASAVAAQEAELAKQTALLAKESQQYQQLADESRGKLKEIGDVQNWAELLERDLLVLEETVRVVEEGEAGKKGGEGEGGGRRWF